jgi:hypothetical protein
VKRTPEESTRNRIRQMYRAERHCSFWHDQGMMAMWMHLARRWKRPIKEIKAICRPDRYGTDGLRQDMGTRLRVRESRPARKAPVHLRSHLVRAVAGGPHPNG